MARTEARFCRDCGNAMQWQRLATEDRERSVCPFCGFIDYVNPVNVVGTVPIWTLPDGTPQVLLCERNIEPRKNYWTLPAGFLEIGESSPQGALRETREEAGARVTLGDLYAIWDVPHTQQVHLYWLATLDDTHFAPGPESVRCQLFGVDEIPWADLSFETVRTTLEHYRDDHASGSFGVHHAVIEPVSPPARSATERA